MILKDNETLCIHYYQLANIEQKTDNKYPDRKKKSPFVPFAHILRLKIATYGH